MGKKTEKPEVDFVDIFCSHCGRFLCGAPPGQTISVMCGKCNVWNKPQQEGGVLKDV